ncbi:MAG: SdpI family protein [Mycobacteriaceae bacterium]|nr:SdpI family protein [Mycobacteriaceae bacterium]
MVGVLPGNRVVGVTTPAAMRTEQTWRLANRTAGPTTVAAGGLLAAGGAAALLIGGIVGAVVAVVAAGTALYTAGSGVAMATRAVEALNPPSSKDAASPCGQSCGGCSLAEACAN